MKFCLAFMTYLLLLFLIVARCQETNKVIFVSLDGFRHDYIDMAVSKGYNVSAFRKLWEQGFRAEVQNVMVTLTFPSHYSMATGRTTEHHGLVGNQFYDPDIKEKYKYTDKIDSMDSRFYEYADNEPIWLTNQRHNGKRTGVFYWPGSDARIKGKMAFATYGLYKGDTDFRYRVDRVIDWISRPEFNFCMLYFDEPDHSGHGFGPNSVEVMKALELVNDGIAYLMQRIESLDVLKGKVNLIVGSDHGMESVDVSTAAGVVKVYERLVLNTDYSHDGSPATLGLWPKEKTVQELYNALQGIPHLNVYMKEDLPDRYHMKRNPRIAPVYAIADLGYILMTVKNQYKNLAGMHGYDNRERTMHPNLVAAGPDIKQLTGIQNFYQVDYYPLICALLNLDKPNTIDGLLPRVLPLLKKPPNEEFVRQFNLYATGILKP